MTGKHRRPTPAQLRYLQALASDQDHPIRVLTAGTQWRVRSNLLAAGLITLGGAGPRPGDNLTEAGRRAIEKA